MRTTTARPAAPQSGRQQEAHDGARAIHGWARFVYPSAFTMIGSAKCIHSSEARDPAEPQQAETARRLILVVEDEPDIRSLVAEHLIDAGFDVCLASNGETAMQLVRERRPGLVCLDLNLPRMSGYEVCEQIRTDPDVNDVAILMTSARNSLDIKAFSLEAGADAYLAKPYPLQRLADEIEELFDLRVSAATPSESLHAR